MKSRWVAFGLLAFASAACGPAGRGANNDIIAEGEVCDDETDNDDNGMIDCDDPACAGLDGCPACGAVENPEVQPLALPDGIGTGTSCVTDADCTMNTAPNCVAKECQASYNSTLNFIGFPTGALLNDPNLLHKVCVNMEHSWMHDLQIELLSPSGTPFILHQFVDRMGGPTFLGDANDLDSANSPEPGIGAEYCWTPVAPATMLEAAKISDFDYIDRLPPGDYKSDSPWAALTGAPLNGEWTMRVTDLWGIDNGYMFSWRIEFDPSLVEDCSGPIIL